MVNTVLRLNIFHFKMNRNFGYFRDDYDKIWPEITSSRSKTNSQSGRGNDNLNFISKQMPSPLLDDGGITSIPTTNSDVDLESDSSPYDQFTDCLQYSSSNYLPSTTRDLRTWFANTTVSTRDDIPINDFCVYWVSNQDESETKNNVLKNTPERNWNLQSNTNDSNALQTYTIDSFVESRESICREEIVTRRRSKVSEKRQRKKEEKQQLKEIVSGIQVAKPDFSLKQATEDFPALGSAKGKRAKKTVKNPLRSETEQNNSLFDCRLSKVLEKSWKPKKKDPICINIGQALQTSTEKCKTLPKKLELAVHRNVLAGNFLDSGSPERKKGKVRPEKVRKQSKLKELILSERKERRKKLTGEEDEEDTLPINTKPPEPENTFFPQYADSTDKINILLAKCSFLETDTSRKINKDEENEDEQLHDEVSSLSNGIHSRKFREYCTNCLTDEVITSACNLLERVAYFQDRLFIRDPIRANAKRRYVAGFNQSKKYLLVKKVKLLVIAPDLEKNTREGGLDDRIDQFKEEAKSQGVPCLYGPNRRRLGKSVSKNALVSCVSILSYEGAEDYFSKVLEALKEAQLKYQALTRSSNEIDKENEQSPAGKEGCDITSSLLATLRSELSPADKLLSAIDRSTLKPPGVL